VTRLGKINTFDFFQSLYPQTGRGVDGFMNGSVFLPMTFVRAIPLSFLGAGVLKMKEGRIQGSLMVYDSHNLPTTSEFEELFGNGANVDGMWRFFTEFGGLPGSHLFLGSWASGKFTSLDPLGWAIIPGQGIGAPQETGSWSLAYVYEQKLWIDPCNKNRNFGLHGAFGSADPKTNPFLWVAHAQVQAQGLLGNREHDTMGVGYFYSGLSGEFKQLLDPFIPVDNLQGVEMYYNATITPWCHFTADLQVVQPGVAAADTAVVFGIRAKIDI
jgi:porin